MDGERFDRLARGFAAGKTRRGLLAGALGAAAGALSMTQSAAAAAKRGPGAVCRKDGECADGAVCKAGTNGRSVCTCGGATKPCGDICILKANCCTVKDCSDDGSACTTTVCNADGTCGHKKVRNGTACDTGDPCKTGACQEGVCVATPVSCPECQVCSGGSCQVVGNDTPCGNGKACCGGTCTSIDSPENCGACGVSCPGTTCYPGVCNAGYCSQAEDTSCICDDDSDCDDGSQCTLSYCSYSSGACTQMELAHISGACVECAGAGDCASGVCCHGRCCPSDAICSGQTGPQGIGICCSACGGSSDYTCCDNIRLDEVAVHMLFGVCVGDDPTHNLPSICCPNGNGRYQYDQNGEPMRDDDGNPIFGCVAPVFHR